MVLLSLLVGVTLQKIAPVDLAKTIKQDLIPLTTTDPNIALNDLAPLGKLLKGVQVLGIGEATHGTSEFCTMKHRMFRYLVEKQGFTVFGLEASMPECIYMDDYVLNGKGDPKAAVVSQGFWTWSTQEMLDLILWMRQYNLNPQHVKKLRVVGYDMQSQVGCTEYFEDKEKEITGVENSLYWENISWEPLDDAERAKTKAKLDDLVAKIKAKQGAEEGRRAEMVERVFFQAETNTWIQALRVQQQKAIPRMQETFNSAAGLITSLKLTDGLVYDALKFVDAHKDKLINNPKEKESFFRELWSKQAKAIREFSKGQKESDVKLLTDQADLMDFLAFATSIPDIFRDTDTKIISYRDQCMASNIGEISKKLFPSQKMMVWAHNNHIMRTYDQGEYKTMGHFLNKDFRKAYFPIGFAFGSGSFNAFNDDRQLVVHEVGGPKENTLDAILGKTGPGIFFTPTKSGLGQLESRSIGALYSKENEDRYFTKFDPAEAYSGLIYIPKTTPTHLLK